MKFGWLKHLRCSDLTFSRRALTSFKGNPTDESEAIEALGLSPKVVKGSLENFKITYPEDLLRVDKLIKGSNHD